MIFEETFFYNFYKIHTVLDNCLRSKYDETGAVRRRNKPWCAPVPFRDLNGEGMNSGVIAIHPKYENFTIYEKKSCSNDVPGTYLLFKVF